MKAKDLIIISLALAMLYTAFISFIVMGELSQLNRLKAKVGEDRISLSEFFKENCIRIFIYPHAVISEIREMKNSLEERMKIRNKSTEKDKRKIATVNLSFKTENMIKAEDRSGNAEKRLYLASYLSLLEEVEKKLKRFNLKGELYIEDFNGSKYANLSEDILLKKIKEKEEKINELTGQTLRKKIDYKGVEINRFRGERYFVFLKEDFGDVTVAWRPLVNVNITDAYRVIKETQKAYTEILGVNDEKIKKVVLYLWDTRENYYLAHKNWNKFRYGAGHASPFYGEIIAHVSPNEPYYIYPYEFRVISHEYVHALDAVYKLYPLSPLAEGLAEYIPIEYLKIDIRPYLPQMNFSRSLYLRYECEKGVETCGEDYVKSYKYNYWFVKFLIEKYGIKKFREIYEISNYRDYEVGWKYINQKFRNVYGKDLEELDKELREWYYSQK